MALWLRRSGFRCYRIGYPATELTVPEAIAHVREKLVAMDQPCHIVGHSLGGVIGATLLRDPQGLQIGRVVQLGSPNRGSPMAEELGARWPVNQICGPALEDLRQDPGRIEPHPDIGAIGGTLGPPGLPMSDPHDGAVTLRSAWCGAAHRIAVPVVHTTLPISFKAARLAREAA